MSSLWEATSEKPSFDRLKEDIETDFLIIGGGMAGVLCAHMLHKSKADYVLVEADTIGSGITKNTTAKITSQHGLIYGRIIKEFGLKAARDYYYANEEAISKYRELCANIDCGFEEKSSYVYSLGNRLELEGELCALKKMGVNAVITKELPLPFSTVGAISFKNQAQFNPLRFLYAVSKGLNIYEHTRVRELKGTEAITPYGRIKAKKIIVATHFPFINKHGAYFLKLYQHRSYVIAIENAPYIDGMYVDEAEKGMSFRNYGKYLLIGGGDHRTGKEGGSYSELRDYAKRQYPDATESFHWATQDCMSLDGVPYIGKYSKSTDNIYVASGFNKWGMTTSMVAASILCDLVRGKSNKYAYVFDPSRTILRPQLAVNAFEAAVNLLTPTSKRCPHLGCALKWNKYERTWDCPCHGSRFTENGKLIDNPATGDLKNHK